LTYWKNRILDFMRMVLGLTILQQENNLKVILILESK